MFHIPMYTYLSSSKTTLAVFGFEGKSQSQGLVERYNGTIKSTLRRRLGSRLATEWKDKLANTVAKCNSNKPRIIIVLAPNAD